MVECSPIRSFCIHVCLDFGRDRRWVALPSVRSKQWPSTPPTSSAHTGSRWEMFLDSRSVTQAIRQAEHIAEERRKQNLYRGREGSTRNTYQMEGGVQWLMW